MRKVFQPLGVVAGAAFFGVLGALFWLFGVWLLWLIYGAVAPTYLTFLPPAWLQMPFWPFAGVVILAQSLTGNAPSFTVKKS